uniref:Uncharacterized protein MANES_13G041100 n=1 Tax=Rhizophora mucronata TaxID=61149 RepID=A0A2P2LNN0_RHIMU
MKSSSSSGESTSLHGLKSFV